MASSKVVVLENVDLSNNWQSGKTLTECNLHMFNTKKNCDVAFQCSKGRTIKAHSYVLISRSCVFYSMFCGPLSENADVDVPYLDYEVFQEFLKYLYTDEVSITSDNATALLFAARKYAVTTLEEKCLEFLKKNMTGGNACSILEIAECFDFEDLFAETLELIKIKAKKALNSAGFEALSQDLVDQIVTADGLAADEGVVFAAINKWAEAECDREGLEINPETKMSLFKGTKTEVKFPSLMKKFQALEVKEDEPEPSKPLSSGLRHNDSVYHLPYKELLAKKQERDMPKPHGRFAQTNAVLPWNAGGKYKPRRADAISFKCNKNLELFGYQLYGSFDRTGEYSYSVISYLGDEDDVFSSLVQDKTTYCDKGEVFDVTFSKPIRIAAEEWYTLAAKITGPDSLRGKEGMTKMLCSDGVEFEFRNSSKSKNGTDVAHGQIPSVMYRVYDGLMLSDLSSTRRKYNSVFYISDESLFDD